MEIGILFALVILYMIGYDTYQKIVTWWALRDYRKQQRLKNKKHVSHKRKLFGMEIWQVMIVDVLALAVVFIFLFLVFMLITT